MRGWRPVVQPRQPSPAAACHTKGTAKPACALQLHQLLIIRLACEKVPAPIAPGLTCCVCYVLLSASKSDVSLVRYSCMHNSAFRLTCHCLSRRSAHIGRQLNSSVCSKHKPPTGSRTKWPQVHDPKHSWVWERGIAIPEATVHVVLGPACLQRLKGGLFVLPKAGLGDRRAQPALVPRETLVLPPHKANIRVPGSQTGPKPQHANKLLGSWIDPQCQLPCTCWEQVLSAADSKAPCAQSRQGQAQQNTPDTHCCNRPTLLPSPTAAAEGEVAVCVCEC